MMSKNPKKTKEQKQADTEKTSEAVNDTAQLQKQIDEITTERDELFEKLQRISADYANYQKRIPKQIADSVSYQKEAIIKSLLPSLDNFEHALVGAANAETIDSVKEGVQIVFEHLLSTLKAHGVERIEALGKEFDPAFHEAIMQRAEDDKPDNIILEEFQRGYTLNGRVIRPSKVIVNKPVIERYRPGEETTDIEKDADGE